MYVQPLCMHVHVQYVDCKENFAVSRRVRDVSQVPHIVKQKQRSRERRHCYAIGLIASIAKVSRPHREVVVAKVSQRTRDTAPRSGQIGIVHNGGSRHEANVCELVRNGDS